MNQKLILGFVAGIVVASGLSYFVGRRSAPAPPVTPSPVAETVAQSVPSPSAPVPQVSTGMTKEVTVPAKTAPTGELRPARKPAQAKSSAPAAVPARATLTAPPVAPAPDIPPSSLPQVGQESAAAPPTPTEDRRLPVPSEPRVFRPETSSAVRNSSAATRTPNTVTVPQGTSLSVRLGEGLSSDRNMPGDEFTGTLNEPLVVNDLVIAERGARVEGRVVDAQKAGRLRGVAFLSIELTRLHASDGQKIPIRTAAFSKDGPESKKEDAAKVGAGAALGAIIGAIAGGGKGAAIGAATGGAAGGGTVAATRGMPAALPVETAVAFRLQEPVTVTERLRD